MIIRLIYVATIFSIFILNCGCMKTDNVQSRIQPSIKTVGVSGSSGIGHRVGSELRCAGDNLYYRGRQTGSRGLLPRVREDLVSRVLQTVANTNDLAEKMILAIRDGTLDLAIARQLDQTRGIAEIREVTTTTTETPDVEPGEFLGFEQSGEYAILEDAVATESIWPVLVKTERPIVNKLAKQIVVPGGTVSSEEESAEDNGDRRSRRRCFYNRLLDDVSTIHGEVGTAAAFLRAYEYNTRRRNRNRLNVTPRSSGR